MDFFRTRTLAYLLGAVEFADNIRLNIVDGFFPFKPHNASSWSQLEGKASHGFSNCPPRQKTVQKLRLMEHD